jgi:hypothetical protein
MRWIGSAPKPFLFTVMPVLPRVTISIAVSSIRGNLHSCFYYRPPLSAAQEVSPNKKDGRINHAAVP